MHETRANLQLLRFEVLKSLICYALLCCICFDVVGQPPDIILSAETTFITRPVDENGLPDFEAYLVQQGSQEVTPQGNAATLLWQVLWPCEVENTPELLSSIRKVIGLKTAPDSLSGLVEVYSDRVRSEVACDIAKKASGFDEKISENRLFQTLAMHLFYEVAEVTVDRAMKAPWNKEEIPSLDRWVQANKSALDQLVVASRRKHFFSPSPSHLNRKLDDLINSLLPLEQSLRHAIRALSLRAMWHLGKDQPGEAWEDLRACLRLGNFSNQGWSITHQLVGHAYGEWSYQRIPLVLANPKTSRKLSLEIRSDLVGVGITKAESCSSSESRRADRDD